MKCYERNFFNLCTVYCKGVPLIKSIEKSKTEGYIAITTIATFLSGVTASMVQITSQNTAGAVGTAVNALLLSSLVFSVASAASSLLVMAWQSSVVYA